jgi:hypothetical protein
MHYAHRFVAFLLIGRDQVLNFKYLMLRRINISSPLGIPRGQQKFRERRSNESDGFHRIDLRSSESKLKPTSSVISTGHSEAFVQLQT